MHYPYHSLPFGHNLWFRLQYLGCGGFFRSSSTITPAYSSAVLQTLPLRIYFSNVKSKSAYSLSQSLKNTTKIRNTPPKPKQTNKNPSGRFLSGIFAVFIAAKQVTLANNWHKLSCKQGKETNPYRRYSISNKKCFQELSHELLVHILAVISYNRPKVLIDLNQF